MRPRAQTLLEFADGSPALMLQHAGEGRFLVCNFSPALTASDLGKYGSFVALTQSIAHYLRPVRQWRNQATVGAALRFAIGAGDSPARLTDLRLVGPDGRACRIEMTGDSRGVQMLLDRSVLPGFHRVTDGTHEAALAAVNIDPRESDLRTIDNELLKEHLQSDRLGLDIHGIEEEGPVIRVRGRPLWPGLLAFAMLAMALELGLLALWKR
jgi:hypothetical protein